MSTIHLSASFSQSFSASLASKDQVHESPVVYTPRRAPLLLEWFLTDTSSQYPPSLGSLSALLGQWDPFNPCSSAPVIDSPGKQLGWKMGSNAPFRMRPLWPLPTA
ncbi:unnamed protein product [Allacma fusca]|uniref:Uncharacterized protein n=1 Tax=Allacma fusca TaxID=39272 RepID=A0A8J2PLK2_9HEXA|nr:unnamed protein product [Allacma fusca]